MTGLGRRAPVPAFRPAVATVSPAATPDRPAPWPPAVSAMPRQRGRGNSPTRASARPDRLRPGSRPCQVPDLFQLTGIEEAAQRVRQFQRAQRRQILAEDPRRSSAPSRTGGSGGRWPAAGRGPSSPGAKGGSSSSRSPSGRTCGSSRGRPPACFDRAAVKARAARPVGQQDDGVGQGLGRVVAQPVQHPRRQILEERPMRLDGIPARAVAGSKGSNRRSFRSSQFRLGLVARLRVADMHPVAVHHAAVQPPGRGRPAPEVGSARRRRPGPSAT
jgi:hypothetical protein